MYVSNIPERGKGQGREPPPCRLLFGQFFWMQFGFGIMTMAFDEFLAHLQRATFSRLTFLNSKCHHRAWDYFVLEGKNGILDDSV